MAGVVPDLDGLTLLAGIEAYERWHHTLTHGLSAALGACGYTAVRFGRSFLEASLPARVDAAAVETLRRRFTPTLRARG